MLKDKYVVIKIGDFDEWWDEVVAKTKGDIEPPAIVKDAVVIRLRDQFAVGALYSYANDMQTFVEGLERIVREHERSKQTGVPLLTDLGRALIQQDIERLTEISDYFAERGDSAKEVETKLPD